MSGLIAGVAAALEPTNLLLCVLGAVAGTIVGVLPGIGPAATVALLLPATFAMPPAGALIMLAAIYYGAQYGSSTAAILLNLPGEASGVVTAIDGHRMALAGRAGPAIGIAALASLVAGLSTAVLIALAAPALAAWSLLVSPAGLVGLMALGLAAAALVSPGPALPALALILAGGCLGLVGTDAAGGRPRFTLGIPELMDGIGFVPVAVGIFGVAELIRALETGGRPDRVAPVGSPWPASADGAAGTLPAVRGTVVGGVLGLLPGGTTVLASLAARGVERLFPPRGTPLGQGAVAGVAAPEAATHAAAQTSLVPLLALGLPATPVMAVLAGAFMIQGIPPGPGLFATRPDVVGALVGSLVVGNLVLVLLNLPLAGVWAALLRIPFRFLVPPILVVGAVGVFGVQNSVFDVWLMLAFGLVGWGLRRAGLEPTPLVLGFVLGPGLEEHLRRTLLLSRGDPWALVADPVGGACALLLVGLVGWRMVRAVLRRSRQRRDLVDQ
ncbi:MAG: tripartite tricarboxylate transporter permease [Rhodospirillales bacterium]